MARTRCIDIRGLKKGTWTREEDNRLKDYVTRYRFQNWRLIAQKSGLSRSEKSCRLRWMNYLRPNVKRGDYSKKEGDTIIKLQAALGNKWSKIASHLPGRTDNGIKNHWHGYLKKRQEEKGDKPMDSPSVDQQITSQQIIDLSPSVDQQITAQQIIGLSPSVDQQITAQSTPFSQKDSSAESSISTLDTEVTNGTCTFSNDDTWLEDTITNENYWAKTFFKGHYDYSTPTNCLELFMDDGLLYQVPPTTGYDTWLEDTITDENFWAKTFFKSL